MPVCGFPWLIATCYVLHRLLAPRHSPNALSSLITKLTYQPLARSIETQRTVICPKSMCSCQRTNPHPVSRGTRPGTDQVRKNFLQVVGVTGLEPVTLRLSSACSNQLSYTPRRLRRNFKSDVSNLKSKYGGAEEIRTPDL